MAGWNWVTQPATPSQRGSEGSSRSERAQRLKHKGTTNDRSGRYHEYGRRRFRNSAEQADEEERAYYSYVQLDYRGSRKGGYRSSRSRRVDYRCRRLFYGR